MQRDAYAAIVRYRNRRKTPVRVLQMNGAVFHENLMEDFFIGYRNRRLALMTHTPGQDPRLPRLPKDIIVPNYKTFLRIHQPHFMYRLLPLLSSDVEAFAAMQAICASPGSPFTIEDRLESQLLNYRLSKMCAGRDRICEFFKDYTSPEELRMPTATRALPIVGTFFQGLMVHDGLVAATPQTTLFRPPTTEEAAEVPSSTSTGDSKGESSAAAASVGDGGFVVESSNGSLDSTKRTSHKKRANASIAALLTTHDILSEAAITQRSLMAKFLESDLYNQFGSPSVIAAKVRSVDERMHFMAVKRVCAGRTSTAENMRVRVRLLELARKQNLHVYEKVDEGEYAYAMM
ncbi:conserved hypothetical protein [Leishmania braziliensis MHOM/BR/75/M2904]|uniref:Uncharacterized protein n=2 Tax=Leishmania braziliensis TaxID=5660 RepID=E9AID7_LEIBR|nr:conserved hypothetical protein [Leishmania braziliensis MHOM/BR/75/M2904]KAI5686754.1 hypothetical protein MNV84_03406 [Leishmania braziliensis]CAJ2471981.1 unnamed protein product [Leishmania braziliensis]CAJ2472496.1 unnamed protein product [Leishmania braziliensis]CBZ14581.1 conserved hypothetical protein [Leishmania braziliensis MHOM/BR/75/M2904]SYZ65525.1 hypothetical_protein [Leishmania braziliensis MHOM/BR/75/M2904]